MTPSVSAPRFSVVIPCYNHGAFVGETIASVLAQSCRDFEVVVVNDGSTDDTAQVVRAIPDPRVVYREQPNRGATAARNTGIRESSGAFIAFLDADDTWHPEKLALHDALLSARPDVGASYNARFDVLHPSRAVRGVWRPPETVSLRDFVLGFPFAPSDLVVRRDWVLRVGLFDERYVFYGDDLDFFGRLALEGCTFAGLPRALTYRKYHSGRRVRDLPACVPVAVEPLERIFDSPACPEAVRALRDEAFARHLTSWATRAWLQEETAVGVELVRRARALAPQLFAGDRPSLLHDLVALSIADDGRSNVEVIDSLLDQLPPELAHLRASRDWAIGRGCHLASVRTMLWGAPDEAVGALREAFARGHDIDGADLSALVHELMALDRDEGADTVRIRLANAVTCLERVGRADLASALHDLFLLRRAQCACDAGAFTGAGAPLLELVSRRPKWLLNKALWSTSFRSLRGALLG